MEKTRNSRNGWKCLNWSDEFGSFFWIASRIPWFKCASFEYKESYFSDNLKIDL